MSDDDFFWDPVAWLDSNTPTDAFLAVDESERLTILALKLDWVRLSPFRRAVAEALVRWAGAWVPKPSQRIRFIRMWNHHFGRALVRSAATNSDLRRGFARDFRAIRHWLRNGSPEDERARAPYEFLCRWQSLHASRSMVPGLSARLDAVLDAERRSFAEAVRILGVLAGQRRAFLEHQEDFRMLCRTKDGRFGWFLGLNPSSHEEGRMMRHCGNTARPRPGDRLLSLREHVTEGDVKYWRPRLTGVLDHRGWLVELKGEANSLPDDCHHRLIAWLLALPQIKGLGTGQRSLPKKDFRLWHLDRDLQIWLLDHRPRMPCLNYAAQPCVVSDLVWRRPKPAPPPSHWSVAWGWVRSAGFVIMVPASFTLFFGLVQVLAFAAVNACRCLKDWIVTLCS